MKVLFDWLKEFVDFTATPEELRMRLSLSGTAVDAIDESPAGPVLDAEITANRPDCLGHYGIAREVAALYRARLKIVDPQLKEASEHADSATRVEIESPDLCGRFTARVIRGVKVAPSPDWLRRRLEAAGQASINNVVDATNYVMFELGHALHAYDFDRLAGHRIVVRGASPGEKIRTLDGAERALAAGMCVIADGAHAVGIGGIMGGAESEISFASRNLLLECAWFDPVSVRRASKALGLRTEASIRFERGADPEMAEVASRRCAELIQQLAGGEILSGVVDAYPRRATPPKIELTRQEWLRVMGADIPDSEIEAILGRLGFAPQRADHNRSSAGSLAARWQCAGASWRHDVTRPIDLVEEIARQYGLEKFPSRLPAAKVAAARLPYAEAEDLLRQRLMALGYCEIVTIPLIDPAKDAMFRAAGVTPAQMANPLTEDTAVLRTSGAVNMLEALEWNLNRGERNLRLFEIGKRYQLHDGGPVETHILTLGATGLAREKSVHEPAREFAFADLKGDLDQLAALAGGLCWEPIDSNGFAWLDAVQAARLAEPVHPAEQAPPQQLAANPGRNHHREIGWAGLAGRIAAERFKLRQKVYLAELSLAPLYASYTRTRAALRYQPIPRFPAVERDFSLVVNDGTTFAEIADAVRALQIPEVLRIEPVDLFRGGQIPQGKYSVLIRVTFQSAAATLTDSQLTGFSARIVDALEKQLGAILRAS